MKPVQLEIPALTENLKKIREFVETHIRGLDFDSDQRYHIVLAVDEACSNVMRYAYQGRNQSSDKIVLLIEPKEKNIKINVRDYGIKCDPSKVCGRDLSEVKPGGLGVHLIHGCMDKVYFNTDIKEGNELILIKDFNEKKRIVP